MVATGVFGRRKRGGGGQFCSTRTHKRAQTSLSLFGHSLSGSGVPFLFSINFCLPVSAAPESERRRCIFAGDAQRRDRKNVTLDYAKVCLPPVSFCLDSIQTSLRGERTSFLAHPLLGRVLVRKLALSSPSFALSFAGRFTRRPSSPLRGGKKSFGLPPSKGGGGGGGGERDLGEKTTTSEQSSSLIADIDVRKFSLFSPVELLSLRLCRVCRSLPSTSRNGS